MVAIKFDPFLRSFCDFGFTAVHRQRPGFLSRFNCFFELARLGKRSVECPQESRFPVFRKLASPLREFHGVAAVADFGFGMRRENPREVIQRGGVVGVARNRSR